MSATCAFADSNVRGEWSAPGNWPLIAAHAVLIPDGRVLTYGTDGNGQQTGFFIYDVWDPAAGLSAGHLTLPNTTNTDIFCSSQVVLPRSGDIFLAGGDNFVNGATTNTGNNNTNVFSTSGTTLARGNNMNRARWYSSSITLINGDTYIQGGSGGAANPEVRGASGSFRLLSGADTSGLAAGFPRNFIAPDGRVFGFDSSGQMYYVTTDGTGSIALGAQLPGLTRWTSSPVMFQPGRILQFGGISTAALMIDINGAAPVVTSTQPLSTARQWVSATALPDGRVLATGGSEVENELTGVNNTAEIWDPATGQWTQGAAGRNARLYHSTALLLPDATVLVAGGGAPGPLVNLNAEIYKPPYLFNSDDTPASRPSINSAPEALYLGEPFSVGVTGPRAISRVTLVKTGSATHSFNMDQRFLQLAYTNASGVLTVQAPAVAGNAPPGYYMLFVIDSQGVPSVARIVRMNVAGTPVPPPPPPPPPPPAFVLSPMTPAASLVTGSQTTFTVSVQNGGGVQYSWNFDDGTPQTPFSSSASIAHTFAKPGIYYVSVTASREGSVSQTETVVQTVHRPLTSAKPTASSSIVYEARGGGRVWVVNADNDSVSVINATSNARIKEITVGSKPRALAIAPNGRIWVTNRKSATISVIDPASLTVVQSIVLPFGSQPHGIAFAPGGSAAYVVLAGTGVLLKLNPSTGAQLGSVSVGPNPRHLAVGSNGTSVYVSRFITRPLAGEGTAVVQTSGGGEVVVVNGSSMSVLATVLLHLNLDDDFETQGRGVPNYLNAPVISPDGLTAWVPSKQDNVLRGVLRDGLNLNFQNTIRAISSQIDLATRQETFATRLDHDNSGVAAGAAFAADGVYLFVALETSREVAVVDAYGATEIFRFNVGRAPQGLALSPDGRRLYVNNFMDRTVGVFDLQPLLQNGVSDVPAVATVRAIATEKLTAQVLKGKQFFYDARDTRLARDAYISCASCHNDGGQDGRVWDFTGMGEGLRNTIALAGRAGAQGFKHWSANFDEVQDFEGQIRTLAGGTGLMTNAAFNTGTRNQPLGTAKAGISTDLDALAAYVTSLSEFDVSPKRNASGALTTGATAGREVFRKSNCAQCHSGAAFTESAAANLRNIGTIKPSSGKRLGGTLTGIDTPTLRDVWATAPYLHDGSASTLAAAVTAHAGVSLSSADLSSVVAYLEQIGSQETTAPVAGSADTTAPSIPTGLVASLSSGKPRLTWKASTDNVGVTGYIVYRTLAGVRSEVARPTGTTYTDRNAVAGKTYTYTVKARDAAGLTSGFSTAATIKSQ